MDNATKLEILELAYEKQGEVSEKLRQSVFRLEDTKDTKYKNVFVDCSKKRYEESCQLLKEIRKYRDFYYEIENFIGFAIFTCPQRPNEFGEFVTTFLTFEEAEEYVEKANKAGYMYFIKGIDKFGKFVMFL